MLSNFLTFSALEIRADGTYTPFSADAWSYAAQMTLLGMGMVFTVLAVLWAVLMLFKVFFAGRKSKADKKAAPVAEKPAEVLTAPAVSAAQTGDDELVAIITAAVAAYMADEGIEAPAGGFRVVSFKRVQGGRAWNSK